MSDKWKQERIKALKDNNQCVQPDRDVPGILCGYPLPCPYHTIVIDLRDDKEKRGE